jgi:hypothetical protein
MATDPTIPVTPPPAAPPTQDNYDHHTSPAQADVTQTPLVRVPVKNVAREITGAIRPKITVPMHVTKHPNPVGRPRGPRGG